ncbi:hypothetical protein E2C01_010090 [Portunus trituberculatus]|uniref:Uncharacterized protein n=1 Tax=Portunus trituberculatus TaxID=210409 RepID=A0A5B7D7H1_PORTR|nr:hypothetical protein [Portunus trituberculatus]
MNDLSTGKSCVRELDRIGMRGRRNPCAARPQEGRHAVNKIS